MADVSCFSHNRNFGLKPNLTVLQNFETTKILTLTQVKRLTNPFPKL